MVLRRRFPGKGCCAFVLRPVTERSKERHRILDPAHDWAFGHHRFAALGLVGRERLSADPMQHNRQPGAGEARTDPSLSIDGREPPNDLQDPGRGVPEHGGITSISQARQQRSVRSMSGQQPRGLRPSPVPARTTDWRWLATSGSGPLALATHCAKVPARYAGPSNFKSRVGHLWSWDIGPSTSAAQTSLNMVQAVGRPGLSA
jgi:hypothetical protein